MSDEERGLKGWWKRRVGREVEKRIGRRVGKRVRK